MVVNPPLGTATIFKIMMSVLPASFAEKVRHTYTSSFTYTRACDGCAQTLDVKRPG